MNVLKISKLIILINIFLLFTLLLNTDQNNYQRALFPITGITYIVDLRYVNMLEKEKKYDLVDKTFHYFIEKENKDDLEPYNKIFAFFLNERKALRNSDFKWGYEDQKKLYNNIKNAILNKESIIDFLPLSISTGFGFHYCNGLISNFDLINWIKENITNDMKVGELTKGKDGYYFTISGWIEKKESDKYFKTIFCIKKLNNTLYDKINNKYELSNIYFSDWKSEKEEVSEKSIADSFEGLSYEKSFVYGIIEKNLNFKIGDKYKVLVDNLRLRDKPDLKNGKVIKLLKKDENIFIIDVGKFDIINDIGADWVNVKTEDNKMGWCFGSYLYIYFNPME